MFKRVHLLAPFLALLLLFSTLSTVLAAEPVDERMTPDEAISLLQGFSIVRGDASGNLRLDDQLTRAEAATIFVRAMNMSVFANAVAEQVPFSDMKEHWSAGEVAMANQIGLMKGDPDGRFRPDDPITYAEVLTVLLRMVEREPLGPWDPAVTMWRALEEGIAPEGVTPSTNANRRNTFWALATTMTLEVNGGKSLLGRNFDVVPPTLLIAETESPTTEEKATLSGTASGAYKVLVGGKVAPFQRATSTFSTTVDLEVGKNDLQVEAIDRAGNRASTEVIIERHPAISKIVIDGPEFMAPKSKEQLKLTAYDKAGNEVALKDAAVKLSVGDHTFNLDTKTLMTGSRRGKATLTVTVGNVNGTYTFEVQGQSPNADRLRIEPVNGGRALAPDKEYAITVQVLNEEDRAEVADFGRNVSLVVDELDGVKVTPSVAETVKGIATFKVEAEDEGRMLLKATSNGLESAEVQVEILESPRIVLTASEQRLSPDGQSDMTIKATLEDEQGRAVTASSDIEIELWEQGTDGELYDTYLTIPKGRSVSDRVTFVSGYETGTVRIGGEVYSHREYAVQTLEIPVEYEEEGPRFVLSASKSRPSVGEDVTITLKLVDERGRIKTTGSYAFQIRVRSGNDAKPVDGLPDGVDLRFEGSSYSPVYDGSGTSVVVGRTYRGRAELVLTSETAGTVYLVPVGIGRTSDAYSPDDPSSDFDEASSGRSYGGEPLSIRFRD